MNKAEWSVTETVSPKTRTKTEWTGTDPTHSPLSGPTVSGFESLRREWGFERASRGLPNKPVAEIVQCGEPAIHCQPNRDALSSGQRSRSCLSNGGKA